MEAVNAIGRRKAAVARVFMTESTGKIVINNANWKITSLLLSFSSL